MSNDKSPTVMNPRRIQRKRIKGWRMLEGAVYVGRGSRFGNPYRVGSDVTITTNDTRQVLVNISPSTAVALYRLWVTSAHVNDVSLDVGRLRWDELAGKDLVCWCPLADEDGNPVPCHADVLLEIANGGAGR